MKKILLSLFFILFSVLLYAQQEQPSLYIGEDSMKMMPKNTILWIDSDSEGILIPSLSKAKKDAMKLDSTLNGLLIYQKDGIKGFYFFDGKQWNPGAGNDWKMGGNANTDPAKDFIGTSDQKPLSFGINNKAVWQITTDNKLKFLTPDISISSTSGVKGNINIGDETGIKNNQYGNILIGYQTGYHNNGINNTMIGYKAGYGSGLFTTGAHNTMLGFMAGRNNQGNRNVFLGNQAGEYELGDNKLYISNSDTKNPLIWGDFANKFMTVNGALAITGNLSQINGQTYVFPTGKRMNGTFLMLKDSTKGELVWENPAVKSNHWSLSGNDLTDTTSYLGTNTAHDLIFKVNREERLRILQNGQLQFDNESGHIVLKVDSISIAKILKNSPDYIPSIRIGYQANAKSNMGYNIAIGYQALSQNKNGRNNLAIGNEAGIISEDSLNIFIGMKSGKKLKNGSENILIGNQAGQGIINGSNNILIGNYVAQNKNYEKLDNKLIIHNNSTSEPLIEGDFANRFVSVNGTLVVGNNGSQTPHEGMIRHNKKDSPDQKKWVFEGYTDPVNDWRAFLMAGQAVPRDGSLPLTKDWNVGEGLNDVAHINVRGDIRVGNFISANALQSNSLQLSNSQSIQFITPHISSFSGNNEIPTSQAVNEFVSGQIILNNVSNNADIFTQTEKSYLKINGSTPLTNNWNVGNFGLENVSFLKTNELRIGGSIANSINKPISVNSSSQDLASNKAVFEFVNAQNNEFTSAILQGGNNFGTAVVIGSNDNQSFEIRTNGQKMFSIDNDNNHIAGLGSSVLAGQVHATISGGVDNVASMGNSTIGGGNSNNTLGWASTIAGGQFNSVNGWGATIGGGVENRIDLFYTSGAATAGLGTIGGGRWNYVSDWAATVSGGQENRATGWGSTVGGGYANIATGWASTVGGGEGNKASNDGAVVAGGSNNESSLRGSTVGGGYENKSLNWYSTISGGYINQASGGYSFVGGGTVNNASGGYSVIGGGSTNKAVAGGSTIGGGYDNNALGVYSTIAGGVGLIANSFAENVVGKYNQTNPNQLFVVGNGIDNTNRSNAFVVYDNGNTFVSGSLQVQNLTTTFVSVSGGVLVNSDRRYKTNIQAIEKPLEKINQLNGYTYHYNKADFPDKNFPETPQIGVIAQEVEAVYPELVATDANGYKSVDYAKFAPIFIESLKAQQKQIDDQKKEIEFLKEQIKKINEMLQK